MNDAERAEVLRNSEIDLVEHKFNVEDLNAANVLSLQQTYRANAARVLKKLAEKFGVFDKTYFNKNISLDFSYSRGSLKESVNKQGNVSTDFYDFAKMLFVFNDVVNNAVPIEAHTDKYAGTERANQNLKYDYVLLSAFSDGDYTIPVEMHIKEFSNKDPNKLYVSVTLGKIKTEDGILAHPSERKNAPANVTPPSSKINVAQLISKVNPGFADFYKYIPSELLTEAQIASKTVALEDEKYRLGVLRGEDVSGMLRKRAEKAGYSPDDSWKMDHRAPNADDDTALDMDTDMLDFFVDNFERILDQAGTETSSETKNTAENSGVKKQAKIGETEDGRGIYKTNYVKNTPKSVKQQDIIDIVQNVWSKKPISLYITEGNTSRSITANFDPTLSERSDLAKIVYGNRKGTASEKRMTLDLSSDFYQIATESKNTGNLSEKGKTNPTHNGVTDWHYFETNIVYEDTDGNRMDCHMNIDVKENPSGNFFYSFSIEKGTAPQTLLAVVADEESTTVPDNSISDLSEKSNPQNMTSEKNFSENSPISVQSSKA